VSECKNVKKPVLCDRLALETVDRFSDTLDLTEHASRIIHPLVRTLDNTPELRKTAMDTLTSVAHQLHRRYLIFAPMVDRVRSKHRIQHQRYEHLLNRLSKVCNNNVILLCLFVTPSVVLY